MSRFAQKVKAYYDAGLWSERMVRDAYEKGRITAEELTEILGE
ncbi:MAG TPA: XkdX family protein [Eggerthellaceae bacterium]|nr:XkdX family protein [Eggerthellaceae bacterium]